LERRRLRVSGARSWNNNLIGTSAPSHGAGGHSGHKVNKIKALPVTALIPVITGTGSDGTEELWRVGRDDRVLRTWIVPWLLDLAMRNRLLDNYRHQTIETARGLVLEVGVGSGLNLPLYGPAVTRVVGLDPSPELLRLATKLMADMVIPVSLLRASAEHLPLADVVFDTIVMTWTLCSIPNPMAALTEMRRVLRPGGR
jgi:SAM-dependent methyltransferase